MLFPRFTHVTFFYNPAMTAAVCCHETDCVSINFTSDAFSSLYYSNSGAVCAESGAHAEMKFQLATTQLVKTLNDQEIQY